VGAIWALRLVGNLTAWLGDTAGGQAYWRQALERGEAVSLRLADDVRKWMLWAAWWGPLDVEEMIRFCDETIESTPSKHLEATSMLMRGVARTTRGELNEGRAEIAAGRGLLRDIGDWISWAGSSMVEAETELGVGNPERAYEVLVEGHDALAERAEKGFLATVIGLRAQVALELGRDDEALQLADEVQAIAAVDDFDPHARGRFVRAVVLARRGDITAADEFLAASAALIGPTDYAILHFDLAVARAEIAQLAGRREEQRAALERALSIAEAKGSVVAADRVREALAEL
jgi:hypothetical protein